MLFVFLKFLSTYQIRPPAAPPAPPYHVRCVCMRGELFNARVTRALHRAEDTTYQQHRLSCFLSSSLCLESGGWQDGGRYGQDGLRKGLVTDSFWTNAKQNVGPNMEMNDCQFTTSQYTRHALQHA